MDTLKQEGFKKTKSGYFVSKNRNILIQFGTPADYTEAVTDNIFDKSVRTSTGDTESVSVMPWGKSNDLPEKRENLLLGNNIVPQLLRTARNIVLGSGFYAYKDTFENGKKGIEEVGIPLEINDFLDNLMLQDFFLHLIRDFIIHQNSFPCFTPARDGTLSKIKVIRAKYIRAEEQNKDGEIPNWLRCRDWLDAAEPIAKVKNLTDFNTLTELREQFIFRVTDPFVGDEYYPVPNYWTGYEWIEIGNNIAKAHKWNLENSYFTPQLIKIPHRFFYNETAVRDGKMTAAEADSDEQNAIKDFIDSVDAAQAGAKKAGKVVWTTYFYDEHSGKEYGDIKIESLPKNSNSEAFLDLFDKTNEANISGTGVHPSLAAILTDSSLSSGSEIRNALLMYIITQALVPRRQILKVMTIIFRMNKWNTKYPGLKIGIRDVEITTLDKNPTAAQSVNIG